MVINCAPLIFYIIINRNRDRLEEEEKIKSYGALYNGKNVSNEDHNAQYYPMIFFWRRLLFIVITVYMFD